MTVCDLVQVYAFNYCDCIYESGYVTKSLHASKAGAYWAMRNYITEQQMEWEKRRRVFGNRPSLTKWHDMSAWEIVPVKVNE